MSSKGCANSYAAGTTSPGDRRPLRKLASAPHQGWFDVLPGGWACGSRLDKLHEHAPCRISFLFGKLSQIHLDVVGQRDRLHP